MTRLRFAFLGLLGLATSSCGDPSFVEKVTIANPYEYNVTAEVSDDGSGWLLLGEIDREREETTQQVIDMGARWIFRFSHRGVPPIDVSLTRSELQAAGWRVQVPESLAMTLRQRGEPPSYAGG